MARSWRYGEYVCTCSAYDYPHRFGGGKCTGEHIVNETWENNYGSSHPCDNCTQLNETEEVRYCEVYSGIEKISECAAWQEFVEEREIKLYKVK